MLRLALLACDQIVPELERDHGDYHAIFDALLAASSPPSTYKLDTFDVVRDDPAAYPPDDEHYDAILISGSRASAYEDIAWINTLIAYVGRIIAQKPSVKIFGICFGHQIVARALGSPCVLNSAGWEVAVTTVQLTPLGKAIFGADHLDLQQMHRDHVPTPPPNTHLLGFTDNTPNHGMVIFDAAYHPDSPIDLTAIRVLTVQGHPEFTAPFMSKLLSSRLLLLGDQLVADGLRRSGGIPGRRYPDGYGSDGVSKVGKAIWAIMGVA